MCEAYGLDEVRIARMGGVLVPLSFRRSELVATAVEIKMQFIVILLSEDVVGGEVLTLQKSLGKILRSPASGLERGVLRSPSSGLERGVLHNYQ